MDRNARLVENEEIFRLGNERLVEVVAEGAEPATRVPFLCECADETCMGRIEMTLDEYRDLRAHENLFVLLVDHPRSRGEEIVARRDGYDITEKPG